MRRRATVTISVPAASSAASICSSERKPPVPAISREDQWRPPSSQVSAPPWIAASTSTLCPSRSGVASHSPRGTTSPSRATATPRASSSAPASRTASASVAASGSSRRSPFSSILIAQPPAPSGVRPLSAYSRQRTNAGACVGARAPYERLRDGFGGQRRQQDAVAVVAGRQQQALDRACADHRQVVGSAGAQAGHRLDQLHLGDLGEQAVGLAQQLVDAAGGDRGVEALLLDGGADDQAAVGARHQVDALGGDDPLAGRGAVAAAQLEDLALDRAHRRSGALGQPLGAARPGAGGEHDRVGPQLLAGSGPHSDQALAVEEPRRPPRSPPASPPRPRRAPPAAPGSALAGRPPASPGAWTPPWKEGVRPGSRSRQRRGGSHSASRPSERCRSWTRRSSAASSRSRAMWRAPWRV